ncbi:hypothetical protein D3C77_765660 [compost metagenome]
MWGLKQSVDAVIVRIVENEYERTGIGQAAGLGVAVYAVILIRILTIQQCQVCITCAFSVQNQAKGSTQAKLLQHPVAG